MRLYLSSFRTGAHPDRLVALANGRRTALVPNALDGASEDVREAGLRRDRDDLRAAGLDVTVADLHEPGVVSTLPTYDIVWVRGGNVFVLRRALADTGADAVLCDLVRRDAVVYGGYSAGACVLAPDLSGLRLVDDPAAVAAPVMTGLGLLDRPFVPHVRSPGHPETAACDALSAAYTAARTPHWALRDGEVLLVTGDKTRLLVAGRQPRPPASSRSMTSVGAGPHREALGALGQQADHRDAERAFRAAGWTWCGAGDWAIALRSPDGTAVARISPFDPTGPYSAALYLEASHTGQVPRLFAHRRLTGGGDLQVMPWLQPVPEDEARAFHHAIAVRAPQVADLVEVVHRVHERARRELPWCGPLDTNPANVMRAADGRLVVVDLFYADGPNLYAAAATNPDLVVALIPEAERRFMTEIPLAASGPWSPAAREAMRAALAAADARRPGG